MTREDIIRMAEQVGIECNYISLGDFAALVAAAEREACAKVCEELVIEYKFHSNFTCATAIRKRGEVQP
jgi:hypothetical protein